jgi:hypothetical protein
MNLLAFGLHEIGTSCVTSMLLPGPVDKLELCTESVLGSSILSSIVIIEIDSLHKCLEKDINLSSYRESVNRMTAPEAKPTSGKSFRVFVLILQTRHLRY